MGIFRFLFFDNLNSSKFIDIEFIKDNDKFSEKNHDSDDQDDYKPKKENKAKQNRNAKPQKSKHIYN